MSRAEDGNVRALRNLNDKRLMPPLSIKVFVEFQPQLTYVHSDRAIFYRAEVYGFSENSSANLVLRKVFPMSG